jgi:hypothetical protein
MNDNLATLMLRANKYIGIEFAGLPLLRRFTEARFELKQPFSRFLTAFAGQAWSEDELRPLVPLQREALEETVRGRVRRPAV